MTSICCWDRILQQIANSAQRFTPVQVVQTGKRGRPKKIINRDWLELSLRPEIGLPLIAISRLAGVSVKHIRASMQQYELERTFTPLTVDELDALINSYKLDRPSAGYRYVLGWLNRKAILVQRHRVLDSLHRMDSLGHALRNHATIDRQVYRVPCSNYLWHMDGHHKLIRWGIVFHGIADGFCRSVSNYELEIAELLIGQSIQ
jgi:hypothetical protein